MRPVLLILPPLLAALPLFAQAWEASVLGAWQTAPGSTYWEQGTSSAVGLRGAWLTPRTNGSRLRVEASWAVPAHWRIQGIEGPPAMLRTQSVALGVARETWFMDDRFCFSVAADLRHTWLESTVGTAPRVTNHLPQLWMRLGLGLRVWSFSSPNHGSTQEPASYSLLRLELGEAAPRGPSATDELLPQREVTLACGVRF